MQYQTSLYDDISISILEPKIKLVYSDTTPSSGDIPLFFTREEYDTSLESSNQIKNNSNLPFPLKLKF